MTGTVFALASVLAFIYLYRKGRFSLLAQASQGKLTIPLTITSSGGAGSIGGAITGPIPGLIYGAIGPNGSITGPYNPWLGPIGSAIF